MTTQKYRPSNGTEGEMFMGKWCGKCERERAFAEDGADPCQILGAVIGYSVDDPEYPGEWVHDESGPRCTAFVPEGEQIPVPRCDHTNDMFGGTA